MNAPISIMRQDNNETKQAFLNAITEYSDDIIISKTLKGIITSWNPAAERVFGYSENEAIGKHISLIIPKDLLYEEDYIISEVTKGHRIEQYETFRVAKNKQRIPIALSVTPIKDEGGNIIGASKIAHDITEKRIFEEKQSILAAIISSSDDAIISKTLKGIITSWNKAAERLFGYTEEEVVGKHISIIIPVERLAEENFIINEIVNGNKLDHFETIRVTKDGRYVPLSITVSPVKDKHGNIVGASKIARDISLQKAAQEASVRYTRSLEIINTVSKTILEDLDQENILQKVADATTQITGADYGVFFYNITDESGEEFMIHSLAGFAKKTSEDFRMRAGVALLKSLFAREGIIRIDDIAKDSRYKKTLPRYGIPKHDGVASYLAVPVISNSNEIIGALFFGHSKPGMFTAEHEQIVASIASIAAIGLMNAKLFQEVKSLNEKKDEFIGMASHELKTPLTSIMGYLQILETLEQPEQFKRFLQIAINQGKKLSKLVSDLLDVSKIEAGKLQFASEIFNIQKTVEECVELVQQSNTTHQIILHCHLQNTLYNGDPQRIEQVLLNLLTNAIKYSPDSNLVEVTLSGNNKEVLIAVKDYGMGISEKSLDLIFSRFYRADEISASISGLGIGLFISHEIVAKHNGTIWAESKKGEGSTFFVKLPR